ncbi:hypothetical protein [Nonomuraea sp. NPDC002799]
MTLSNEIVILSLEGPTTPLVYREGDTPDSFAPLDYCLPHIEVTMDEEREDAVTICLYAMDEPYAALTLQEAVRVHAILGDLLRAHSAV